MSCAIADRIRADLAGEHIEVMTSRTDPVLAWSCLPDYGMR
jgi:hypothetical protein